MDGPAPLALMGDRRKEEAEETSEGGENAKGGEEDDAGEERGSRPSGVGAL